MSSSTEFDWIVAEICETLILKNKFQKFSSSVFMRGAKCKLSSKLMER